jgi:hypothetical protein
MEDIHTKAERAVSNGVASHAGCSALAEEKSLRMVPASTDKDPDQEWIPLVFDRRPTQISDTSHNNQTTSPRLS